MNLPSYSPFVIYIAFVLGIVAFVLSLRKFTLRYQFHQFGWTLMTIIVIVMQCCAHLSNIYAGLVWFMMSTTLIITNDVFAYIVGQAIGKTRLIALSPKKTVEGFVGAAVCSVIWAIIAVNILRRMDFFLCPQPELANLPFSSLHTLKCDDATKALFAEEMTIPYTSDLAGNGGVRISVLSFHAMILALAASLVAPFGGFFASGRRGPRRPGVPDGDCFGGGVHLAQQEGT